MIKIHEGVSSLSGPKGSLPIRKDDQITLKLAMLFEGQCEGLGPIKAAEKFGYTRQRYYQILHRFIDQGAKGLKGLKPVLKGTTAEPMRSCVRSSVIDFLIQTCLQRSLPKN